MGIHQDDVIYFLLTDRFHRSGNSASMVGVDRSKPKHYHGGNLNGIIQKIPYLKNLGITAIWITPVYLQIPWEVEATSNTDWNSGYGYHGYWTLDFNQMDPHLIPKNKKHPIGSKLYLKDFVDTLHANGLKLILDIVVNHTGYFHPGFTGQGDNPTPIQKTWFNQENATDEIEGKLAKLPDFDLDFPDVADYHIQSIISWIAETGIDGIRMDTAKHVEKVFWQYYKTQILGMFPNATLIGEVMVNSIEELAKFQQYWAFDSLFDFPLTNAMENAFCRNGSMTEFVTPWNQGGGIFEKDTHYTNQNRLVTLLDNHDLKQRFMTLALQSTGGDREAACKIVKLALTFQFTVRGIPQIYYGTEIGMEGNADPDNRQDFDWSIIGADQFVKTDSSLPLTDEARTRLQQARDIQIHVRNLIHIRKQNQAFTAGMFECLYVNQDLIVFLRYVHASTAIVIINKGPKITEQAINIRDNSRIPTRIKQAFANRTMKCQISGTEVQVNDGLFSILDLESKSAMILI